MLSLTLTLIDCSENENVKKYEILLFHRFGVRDCASGQIWGPSTRTSLVFGLTDRS
jgi:hypothetical protein